MGNEASMGHKNMFRGRRGGWRVTLNALRGEASLRCVASRSMVMVMGTGDCSWVCETNGTKIQSQNFLFVTGKANSVTSLRLWRLLPSSLDRTTPP